MVTRLGLRVFSRLTTTTEVDYRLEHWLSVLDNAAGSCLPLLAVWILVSSLDDLFVSVVYVLHWLLRRSRRAFFPCAAPLKQMAEAPARRIAVFVPLWREQGVIEGMIEHNISAIKYKNYDFFVGAYPNDPGTQAAIRKLESRFANVHLSLCPHDGPTSKADCLNWIYQRMLLYEEQTGERFDVVVTHDAEDLIHPDAFHVINYYAADYAMIQVPVLPLPTPWLELTHALYCDDFSEAHTKDLVVRGWLGGFVPSSGVGTGYTREALEQLAVEDFNRVFEPACLTEDYENGLRLRELGLRQMFYPITLSAGVPVATREYFPRRFRAAVRQRTRWITGIALQGWQRHGWGKRLGQVYWLWRDRKGLIGNPASAAANVLFLYGSATWLISRMNDTSWGLAASLDAGWVVPLLSANVGLLVLHLISRAACVGRVYGWAFALGVPLRTLYGNWVNTLSTFRAFYLFARAMLLRQPLVWLKTEHYYPSRASLLPHKRPLEEILVGSGYVAKETLAACTATKPPGMRLCEHLVRCGHLTEEEWYEALSIQQNIPWGRVEPHMIPRHVARALPAHVARKWLVLPYRIAGGSLYLASPEVPGDEVLGLLRRLTRLECRFQLVTPTNFRLLAEALL